MHRWTRVAAAVAAGLMGLAVAPTAAADTRPHPAVTGGYADAGAHPYVAMVLAPHHGSPNCTGVLVRADNGARVVLTDAHCLSGGAARSGGGVGVTFSPTWGPGAAVTRGTFFIDPLYAPGVSPFHDLAAIVLRPTPPVYPATMVGIGGSALRPGTRVTVVGTGQPHPGQRRQASEVVQGLTPNWLVLVPGSGNSCDGDSGGPDLWPGSSTVVALTDQGTCAHDYDTPVGTWEAHWFAAAASTAAVGDGVHQPSVLGLAAARSGGFVVIHGDSRFLDITSGRFRSWPGNQVGIQRWTRTGWATIRGVTTDGNGNFTIRMHIPFRVGLRLVTGPNTPIGGAISGHLIR